MSNKEERIKIQKKINEQEKYTSIIKELKDLERLQNIEKNYKKDKFRRLIYESSFFYKLN